METNKLDVRLKVLLAHQKRIKRKIEAVQEIIKLRRENEMSLRAIGKKVGMSGQNVHLLLKQFRLK